MLRLTKVYSDYDNYGKHYGVEITTPSGSSGTVWCVTPAQQQSIIDEYAQVLAKQEVAI